MPSTLSAKMNQFQGSASVALSAKVSQLRSEGKDIISLVVGEPDFPTPEHICEAGIRAIRNGHTKYTVSMGLPELRKAIARKLKEDNQTDYSPDEIIVSTGAKQALMSALMAVTGEGDEVIIPTPCYVSYPDMVRLTGAVPVFAACDPETYALDVSAIREKITPRTKAVIVCSPCNPTGAVFTEESLRSLAELAVKHDFFVLSDEIYEKLVFGTRHFSTASVSEEVRNRTITVNGFSKSYAMTGWRIGYAAARRDVIAAINKIQSQNTTCVSGFTQLAALEALEGPQDSVEEMRLIFEERMKYCRDRFNAIPGINCPKAGGAFYLFPDVSAYIKEDSSRINSDVAFCEYLLEEGGVAVMPGSAYMRPGSIRISYAASMEELTEAMNRMEAALAKLTV